MSNDKITPEEARKLANAAGYSVDTHRYLPSISLTDLANMINLDREQRAIDAVQDGLVNPDWYQNPTDEQWFEHPSDANLLDGVELRPRVQASIHAPQPSAWMDEFGNIVSASWKNLYDESNTYNRPLALTAQSEVSEPISDERIMEIVKEFHDPIAILVGKQEITDFARRIIDEVTQK